MGFLRGVARTAVVAKTATTVSKRVSRRQAGRWAQQEQPAQTEQAPAPAAASSMDDKLTQLKELGTLRDNGVLSDGEFEAQKKKILVG